MKKILLGNKFFYLKGGSEQVFFQERGFLLENGWQVFDFSMYDVKNIASPSSQFFIPHIEFNSHEGITARIGQAFSFIHSRAAVQNIKQLLSQNKPDIAHLHNIYHQITPAIIPILKEYGVKVIVTLHDCKLICPSYLALNHDSICTECQGKHFWKPITLKCRDSLMSGLMLTAEALWHKWRKSYDEVDLFITPSRFLAQLISMRIPQEKIRVLHNGINHEKYVPCNTDGKYFLYFGRLSREKGVNTLLKAYRVAEIDLPLKIAGTGSLYENLRTENDDVEFLGFKTGRELMELVASAAFVVVPSECYENCSMVVLEAMALGKAVIGSRTGGIPEQIEDGVTGLLFTMGKISELAEKIRLLSANQELRTEMGINARKKLIKEYSLAGHCNKLLDIYAEVTR